jgi:hypothetical protein
LRVTAITKAAENISPSVNDEAEAAQGRASGLATASARAIKVENKIT